MFPELTAERRSALVKVLKEKLEQAKITLRGERDVVWSDIQEKERTSAIGKDEKFRYKEEMEKIVTDGTRALEEAAKRKEQEILS
jgi:ribosome recycling factor